jgi:hypothetical protein
MKKCNVNFRSVSRRSYVYEVTSNQDEYCDNVENEAVNDPEGRYKLVFDDDDQTKNPLWFAPRYQTLVNDEGDELEVEVPPPFKSGEVAWLEGKQADDGRYLLGRYNVVDSFESAFKRASTSQANAIASGFKRKTQATEAKEANFEKPQAQVPATPVARGRNTRAGRKVGG